MNGRTEGEGDEHYVTRFDHRFLLQGLALYRSLREKQPESVLWVVCLDAESQRLIDNLKWPGLNTLSLAALETPELLEARRNRTATEYIYTLSPFLFDFVFDKDPGIRRVTYLDADLFFFKSPTALLRQLEDSGRQILITEHGFAPEYQSLAVDSGRFCVQFLTVSRDGASKKVIARWQRQCLDACGASPDNRATVFGDQKYLEEWPNLYPDVVFVCPNDGEMQAPWNVDHIQASTGSPSFPVFYHFHSFRIFHPQWVQLCAGYMLGDAGHLYDEYLAALSRLAVQLRSRGIPCPHAPMSGDRFWLVRMLWRLITNRVWIRRFSS